MNVHEAMLSELVRQRQLDVRDDARNWSSRLKRLRRTNRTNKAA